MAKSNEPSTLSEIMEAASQGMSSPSPIAKVVGGIIAPHGAKEAAAQGLQGGVNAAVTGSKAFMEATVRQHGRSPSAVLNDLQIKQNIAKGAQLPQNKGIEAFKQKSAENQTAPKSGQSTNKGIMSFQSKQSGQSASGTTKAASPSVTSKAASPSGTSKAASPSVTAKGPSASGTSKAASPSVTTKGASPSGTSKAASPSGTIKAASASSTSKAASPSGASKAASASAGKSSGSSSGGKSSGSSSGGSSGGKSSGGQGR